MRGLLGIGSNKLNRYTVAKISQGLSNYLIKCYENGSVAVSYDSRRQSLEFARIASSVLASNGIQVYLFPELMPTPCLSFATRYYHCSAGIMITASHNPAEYNGYKVYNSDGCQITNEIASLIQTEADSIDIFADVQQGFFDESIRDGKIKYISSDCFKAYIDEVKKQSVLYGDKVDKDISVVYSPLNGTGLKAVKQVLLESGYRKVTIVKEQE